MKMTTSFLLFIFSYLRDLIFAFTSMINRIVKNWITFIKEDHTYVYLGGSILVLLSILLSIPYFGAFPQELTFSIFYTIPDTILFALLAIDCVFVVISLFAFLSKYKLKENYQSRSAFTTLKAKKLIRYFSYYVGTLFIFVVFDSLVLGWFISSGYRGVIADTRPSGDLESMFYIVSRSLPSLKLGIETTIQIALVGTILGFVFGCLLVFMRIQKIDKRDNDFIKLIKVILVKISKFYINIIRSTPMMVQAIIIYYFGMDVFKAIYPGLSASELAVIWPLILSGMVTVTINSTAYIAEVLRGAVESIDKGQTEAARSLGMNQWMTMMNVLFPQAVKNSIPAIGNEFIINIKDSSVLRVIGVFDLMYAASTISGNYVAVLEIYIPVAIIYFIITMTLTSCLNVLAKKLDMPDTRVPSSN